MALTAETHRQPVGCWFGVLERSPAHQHAWRDSTTELREMRHRAVPKLCLDQPESCFALGSGSTNSSSTDHATKRAIVAHDATSMPAMTSAMASGNATGHRQQHDGEQASGHTDRPGVR